MIITARLNLVPFTADIAAALVAGDSAGQNWADHFPREDDQDAARMFLRAPDDIFAGYLITVRETGLTVGSMGFFGPPDQDGEVMIGYGLVPGARGAGYATEALKGLVAFAFEQPKVSRVVADPDLTNVASHRVLEKAGFVRTHATATSQWYQLSRPPGNASNA